jgi:tripartite-type tricarboxylate transporter receptor subunit TctC
MSEAGLPGFNAVAWYGILGPAGIPPTALATLSRTSLAVLDTKEAKDRLFASGVEVRPGTPEEFTKLIRSEMEKWAKVVKDSGAKAN